MKRLDDRLTELMPANVLEQNAKIVENNQKILQATPLGIYVI